MTPQEETLELYKQEIARSKKWDEEVLRLVSLEVGAKMRSPATSTSRQQQEHVLENARWAYNKATGRNW